MATSSSRSGSLPPLILVVNHKPVVLKHFVSALDLGGYQVETAVSAQAALERLEHPPVPNLVLMDIGIGADGLETLQRARKLQPDLKVVILGAIDDTRKAAQVVRLGAVDYLPEPFHESELRSVLTEHLVPPPANVPDQAEDTEPTVIDLPEGTSFVSGSTAMKRIHAQASVIAKFDMPVLLLGESGTGKEVVSLLIHYLSPRANYPFLKVNCAAVPADLLESELFRLRGGRLHRRHQSPSPESSNFVSRVRSYWMKSAKCRRRCRPSCCIFSRTIAFRGWAAEPLPRLMSVFSRLRISGSKKHWRQRCCVKTSITV